MHILHQNPNLTLPGSYKSTITNIINDLLKILIISPPWPFDPIATVWFRFSPNLSHLLGTCSSHVTMFLHPIKSVTHIPHHKIHPLHHLRHGLHLKFKFSLGMGWCVVLIWHDSTCKNWLVVKKISSHRSCFAQTLLISSHLSSHYLVVLAELKPTPNRANLSIAIQICIYDSRSNKNQKQAKTKLRW